MKFEEISKELNIPLWKVKNIYFSGMNKLRENIKRDKELRDTLRKYMDELNTDSTPYRGLLERILYDTYGKDKL